jgi:hypothetical protein
MAAATTAETYQSDIKNKEEDSSSQAWQARTSNEKKDVSRRLETV